MDTELVKKGCKVVKKIAYEQQQKILAAFITPNISI